MPFHVYKARIEDLECTEGKVPSNGDAGKPVHGQRRRLPPRTRILAYLIDQS